MQIKGKDGYKIEALFELSGASMVSLMSCYQALIGPTAVSLYMTLYAESKNQRSTETHQRLCALMGIDIVTFELARGKCEEVNLLVTWHQSGENKDDYIYALNKPLPTVKFLSHDVLGRRYYQLVGNKNVEITRMKHVLVPIEKNQHENISKQFKNEILQSWNREDEVKFNRVKPIFSFQKSKDQHIEFDYDSFLKESTNLTFPIEARTPEALEVIGELATVYGISADRMRILVGRCINNSTNILDITRLKNLASYEKPKEKKSKNPYDVSPVQFLMEKQGGIPVTVADGKLLEYLVSELKMNQEVVNFLIEYVLNINSNRLSNHYVQKVAGEWIRDGVTDISKAKEKINQQPQGNPVKKVNTRKAVLPKNFNENKERVTSNEKMNQADLEVLKQRMKQLEG